MSFVCSAKMMSANNVLYRCQHKAKYFIDNKWYCGKHLSNEAHPEDFCQECGRPNIVWFAPNELWNKIVGSSDGILCPTCFAKRAEKITGKIVWRFEPME